MVTFLLDRLGTPKNEYIVDKIATDVANGTPAFWLVPEQRAVLCERTLALKLDPSAQLIAEVLNFTRLGNKVFRESGGLKHNYITRSGKSLIMYHALCQVRASLEEYTIPRGRERGFVDLFLDAVGEIKSYCVSPAELEGASASIESPRLKGKIADLVRVFGKYNELLTSAYSDPYDDLIMLAEKLEQNRLFEGANVYISSFDGFTGAQMKALQRIFEQAENVYVALDMRTSDIGKIQYLKLTETLRALENLAKRADQEIKREHLGGRTYHENPCLDYLSDNVWSFGAPPYEGEVSGITLMRPSDEFDECERVAGKIKELVMNGARYGEIAVIMRSADTYRGIIDYCFDKYDIPYYASVSTDITLKPLIRFIFSAIGASSDYNTRDIISFIRSGYAGISYDDADELESYIYRWGIYGKRFENDDFWSANPDGYETETTDEQRARLGRINDTRARVIELLLPLRSALQGGSSAPELCRELYNLLLTLKVRETIKAEMEGAKSAEKKELSQLYRATIRALSEVADIMPDEPIDKEGFVASLSYVLNEVKIGTIPTGEDNVTIGEAGALRTESIKYAFVIGVCEGSFPQVVQGGSFFSDSDKKELKRLKINLSAGTDIRADDELLNFKNSIAIASRALTVSAPCGDIKGAKREPSMAYRRIIELFPALEGAQEKDRGVLDKLYTEKIAREYSTGETPEAHAIRKHLGISERSGEASYSNDELSISPSSMSAILKNRLYLSQSKIEKFVGCRFAYYCKYALKLKDSEKISFGAREVGVLTHSVLEHFLRQMKGADPKKHLTDEEISGAIDEITDDYIRLLYPQGEPTSKLKHLFARLKSNLLVYIRELEEEREQSDFVPELFEIKFSRENGIEPLCFDLGDGRKITLTGTADRVDVYEHEGKLYLRVVDYKTGEKAFSFDEFRKGLQLQLFIYLFTLCSEDSPRLKEALFGERAKELELVPAGVMYYPMELGKGKIEASTKIGEEEEREAIKALAKRRGVFLDDEIVLRAQDKEMKGRFLPKKGNNKKYYCTSEQFDDLKGELESILREIGKQMLDGNALAKPETEGEHGQCSYCTNRAICRRRRK